MSRPHRHRAGTTVRVKLVLVSAAAVGAALSLGLALVPGVADAFPGRSAAASAHSGGPWSFLAWWHERNPGRPTPPIPPPRTTPAAPPTTAPTTSPVAPPPATGDPNPDCTLIVPLAPLSAGGLATPYRFTASNPGAGACHEANTDQSAFVEAAILDPATGAMSIYHPLVIDDGTQPAVAPVRPRLPRNAVVGVWFGYQANVLTLRARHARRGVMSLRFRSGDRCVNGLPGSPFGQYGYCGAPQFFAAANAAIRSGKLKVPDLGTGKDGLPCPTTRDFGVVDQDQSDNLPTKYLATSDGRTAQFSAANTAALRGATVLTNASDNGLVDNKLDPVLGCAPPTAPDLSAGGSASPALALNELQAAAHQAAPIALVPTIDPMTLVNGRTSVAKTNLYRAGVDMGPINTATETGLAYCTNMATVAVPRLQKDEPLTSAAPSPDPAVASDLHGFLVARLNASWGNLGCAGLTGKATPAEAAGQAAVTTSAPTTSPTAAAPVPAAGAGGDPAVAATADQLATTSPTSTPPPGGTATGRRTARVSAATSTAIPPTSAPPRR